MATTTRRLSAILVAALLTLPVAAAASPRPRGPVYGTDVHEAGTRNFPDPALLRADGRWFAYATGSTGGTNLTVISSDELWDWQPPAEALPEPPNWARSQSEGGAFWAPSVIAAAGRYVLYFAARHRAVPAGRPGWCIGAATSTVPGGPFTPVQRPVVCRVTGLGQVSGTSAAPARGQGMIDPFVYRSPGGGLYLLAKANDRPWQLTAMALSADGLTVRGAAHGLLQLAAGARTWEYSRGGGFTVLENPAIDYDTSTGGYQLFYSGSDWASADYATGLAECRSPLGPCTRTTTRGPWLRSARGVVGPGGLSVTVAGRQRWVAYHSWARGKVGGGNGRRLHVEPLTYAHGVPKLQQRAPRGRFHAASDLPGTVTFTGAARDPDTGQPTLVTVREEGTVVARGRAVDGRFEFSVQDVELRTHRYCATFHDDHRGANAFPPCEVVNLGL